MTTKELREIVKTTIIAQNGKLYGFNSTNIRNMYGASSTAIQNAINYFKYSPQQKTFRETYNFY